MRRTVILIAVGAAVLLCGTLLYRHFTRTKGTETEQKMQSVSDTAKLYSFAWHQSAENADACFVFSFGAAEETEATGHYLSCTFRTPDGETAEHTDVPVTDAQWSELEAALRSLTLPSYAPPDPYLMDATDSCIFGQLDGWLSFRIVSYFSSFRIKRRLSEPFRRFSLIIQYVRKLYPSQCQGQVLDTFSIAWCTAYR